VIRAILFDLDGVLVDSYEAWFDLVNAVADQLGCPRVTRETYSQCWGQSVDADSSFYPGHSPREIERRYLAEFRNHTHRIDVNRDAGPVFAALRERGLKIAVITNTPSPMARDVLAAARLSPDVLVGGTDVPRAKPAADMVLKACEMLNVELSEAIVIGDSRYDKEASRAAGVRFAGFGGIEGDHTFEHLTDLLCLLGRRE
jgi:HAD superfamily hydrolase (TIGR01549 family)